MIDINVQALNECWEDLRKTLKEGLLAGDIWDRGTGLSLSGYNPQPAATALLNQLTDVFSDTLSGAGFPTINRFYIINLDDGHVLVVVKHGEQVLQAMVLDSERVNMGILMMVAIPKALAKVAEATN